jgi:hypothetical protein
MYKVIFTYTPSDKFEIDIPDEKLDHLIECIESGTVFYDDEKDKGVRVYTDKIRCYQVLKWGL